MLTEIDWRPYSAAVVSFPYDSPDDDKNAEQKTAAGQNIRKDRRGTGCPAADRQKQNEETDNDHLKKQQNPGGRTEAAVFAERKKDDPG